MGGRNPIGVGTHQADVGKRAERFQHLQWRWPERHEIPQNPISVGPQRRRMSSSTASSSAMLPWMSENRAIRKPTLRALASIGCSLTLPSAS